MIMLLNRHLNLSGEISTGMLLYGLSGCWLWTVNWGLHCEGRFQFKLQDSYVPDVAVWPGYDPHMVVLRKSPVNTDQKGKVAKWVHSVFRSASEELVWVCSLEWANRPWDLGRLGWPRQADLKRPPRSGTVASDNTLIFKTHSLTDIQTNSFGFRCVHKDVISKKGN